MSKRGMSTLVASLILVTLCLVALVFVGITIKNSFKDDSNQLEVDQFTLDLEISQVQILNETDVEVTLKRNSKENELSGAAFVFYDEDDNEISRQNVSIKELEDKNFSVVLKVVNSTLIEKISIAPIFKKRFGKDVLGEIQDKKPISYGGGGSGGSSSSGGTSSDSGSEENQENVEEIEENLIFIEEELYLESECGVCDVGFICLEGVCEYEGEGNLYYVSLEGDNSNPGTLSKPWRTFQHAILVAEPGDTVYIRGGVYSMNYSIESNPEMGKGASGNVNSPIRFLNYPGERPIFDWEGYVPVNSRWTNSISFSNVEYIHFRGFTVRNVRQQPPDFTIENSEQYSWAMGFSCGACANIIYENMVVHDIDGRAFQHWTGAWSDFDADYALELCLANPNNTNCEYQEPKFDHDITKWVNCDAYNLYDRYSASPGNHADGWKVGTTYGNKYYWINTRAWNYSDDGYDPHGGGTRIFDGALAMSTFNFQGLSDDWAAEMNGFKMTGANTNVAPGYVVREEHLVQMKNSLAVDCGWTGFYNNVGGNQVSNSGAFYNNFAFNNQIGFGERYGDSVFVNNIAYKSQGTATCGGPYDVAMYNVDFTTINSTWEYAPGSCKWWVQNPLFNVNDDDFVSLDTSLLLQSRNDDFTLPHTDFGKLVEGSDLIDRGALISDYHCNSPGRHPELDCREWAGVAPDLGPYEFDLEPELECVGPTVRQCSIGIGIGEEKRTCVGPGEWSSWSSCEFVGCENGYELLDGECVVGPGWSRELLSNGGFENGIEGWVANGAWEATPYTIYGNPRTPHSGYYVVFLNQYSSYDNYLYQDVDLREYSLIIDDSRLVVNASGWAITPAFNGAATSRIQYQFLDENKNLIHTPLDTGFVSERTWWEASVDEEPVPIRTRHLRVWMNTYAENVIQSGDLDSFSVRVGVLS
jgi:hypothetical protein